jgi:hypothetical protein
VKERAMAGRKSAERFQAETERFWREGDNMLAYLVKRADDLAAHADNPSAEAELERIVDLIEAYETKRWPSGKVAGGKG